MSQKGALGVEIPRGCTINSITIQHDDAAAFSYDPAIETYDIFYTESQSFESDNLTSAGFPLDTDDLDAKYPTNLQGGLSLNNRIAISQVKENGNTITPWTLVNYGGLKSMGGWHNLAICNLKEGDRVVIQLWQGEAKFSSKAENTAYNGCGAFKDVENNGEFDEGDDTNITCGMSVESQAAYVITEEGHLDIALAADAIICKITIYGDHQAQMVDEYGATPSQGNRSYFDTTGQLETKHHIVPGGLHVYIGNQNDAHHAEVVMSDEGPVSFVYDENHFKTPNLPNGSVDRLWYDLPIEGTFYRFVPDVDGTMTVRFKANSVNYRDWTNHKGNEAVDQAGTPNETNPNVSCPYYLFDGDNLWGTRERMQLKTNGETAAFENVEVKVGKTYYLYGWWNDTNNYTQYNNHACGVAELIDVTFKPSKYISPLAKWVKSGATASDLSDLATVLGYNQVCIKKKSDNIESCTAAIGEDGKLKITKISYKSGANPGGVVLIKVGAPNNDADPVFALTIAYDASFNKPDGAARSEGHTWNFSENSLHGLKWNNKSGEADVTDFGTHFINFATAEKDDYGVPTNGVNSSSFLTEEINKGDWTFNYRVKKNGTFMDPRFLNTWDMEGDNADMMWDTEGLIIKAGSTQSCIFNEHGVSIDHTNKTQADPDRYVGFLEGGSFIIPKLKAGDRVIVYMGSGAGSGAQAMKFHITNALDAVHNPISPTADYFAGGSMWNVPNGHNDPYYRGCYHFYAAEDGDMEFKMVGGSMCKLYSIEIYSGERQITNNVLGTRQYFGTEGDGDSADQYTNLHYRGKGEMLANGQNVSNEMIATSGNISSSNVSLRTNGNDLIWSVKEGTFGVARMRLKCMEYNQQYVTDFADYNVTIGYKQKVDSYPYTWDFTDIPLTNGNGSGEDVAAEYSNYPETTKTYEDKGWDLSMWDKEGKMIVRNPDYPNNNANEIFAQNRDGFGNQLWANGKIIPETKGLWFYMDNNDAAYNGSMKIDTDGLHLANTKKMQADGTTNLTMGWWNYKMVVPDVPVGAAVYLRMTRDKESVADNDYSQKTGDVPVYFLNTKFNFGTEAKTDLTPIVDGTATYPEVINNGNYLFYNVKDAKGENTSDWILAVKNTKEAATHLVFTLNGWVLKKLSISTDEKIVNKYGWNTESREHAIDPSLLSYMTGKDFRAYIVTAANEATNTVTLARIDGGSGADGTNTDATANDMKLIVPGATKVEKVNNNDVVVPDNGSRNAYIIRNAGDAAVDMFGEGSGFHLFVPDMHDSPSEIPSTNLLKARVTATSTSNNDIVNRDETEIKTENDETTTTITANNYAFTYIYKKVNNEGVPYTGPKEGKQAFYRIVSGGAQSLGHQAYLSIPVQTGEPVQEGGASRSLVATTSQPAESYNIVFQEWNNIEQLKGDVNGDGRFNKLDVNTTADYLAGRPAGIFKGLADMNSDGRVDIIDLTLMIQKISGK